MATRSVSFKRPPRDTIRPQDDATDLAHVQLLEGTDWLPSRFFDRPAADVARDLLGKRLVRRLGDRQVASAVVEAEAYVGPHDLACHAARGRTPRTQVMFGPPGTLYVYLIYGLHWMLNVVTGEEGYPAAVLIRGIEGATGPGRVTKALDITGALNGAPSRPETGLWFDGAGTQVPRSRILRTPRIGIDYAGPVWASKKLRFVLKDERHVLRRRKR